MRARGGFGGAPAGRTYGRRSLPRAPRQAGSADGATRSASTQDNRGSVGRDAGLEGTLDRSTTYSGVFSAVLHSRFAQFDPSF